MRHQWKLSEAAHDNYIQKVDRLGSTEISNLVEIACKDRQKYRYVNKQELSCTETCHILCAQNKTDRIRSFIEVKVVPLFQVDATQIV